MPEHELDLNSDSTQKDKDEKKSVPLEALEAERAKRHALEREVAEIRGQLKGLQSAPPAKAEEKKHLTAAELRQAVDEGKITQAEADELRDRQLEDRIAKNVSRAVESSLSNHTRTSTVTQEIARYKAAVPDLLERDSDAFKKVAREFDYLVGTLGEDPDDVRTELKAARAAFGPVAELEKVKARDRETYNETGGHGDQGDSDLRKDGSPKGMSADLRAHYQKQIDLGIYKGWKDPVLVKEVTEFGDRTRRNRASRQRTAA